MMIQEAFADGYQVHDPPLMRRLFGNTGAAWLWLVVRLWLGYQWLDAGLHKLGDPAWTGDGSALRGFWKAAVAPGPRSAIAYEWYRAFVQLFGTPWVHGIWQPHPHVPHPHLPHAHLPHARLSHSA